jgi:hypothetical protein
MDNSEQKIECVIVAFKYLDFLSLTIQRNLDIFDHVIVVTLPDDPVVEFCKKFITNKLTIVETNAPYFQGANWNKGLTLTVGLEQLKFKKYFCIIDSDILSPLDFREQFFNFATDKQLAYGSRRFLLPTRADYEDFIAGRKSEKDYLLLRGAIYGFHQIFHYESDSYQNFLKKNNNIKFIHWIKENHTIDWLFLREWNDGQIIYNPPLDLPYPECHFCESNDYYLGLCKELPFHVAHLGDPGEKDKVKKLTFD